MTDQIYHPPDSPPVFDADKVRARWAAAKADYLAGGSGPEVCERYGLILRTFRDRASKEGWRRADQPEPDPTSQNDPLVIPDAPPGASRDAPEQPPPPTASEMVDKAWSHVQAAVAAGQLIQARGWLRLYKELKLHVPFAEMEARRAAAPDTPPSPPPPPEPDPTGDLVRLTTRLAAVAQQAEKAACDPDPAPPLHCFSDSPSNPADDLTRLVAGLQALTGKAEHALTDEALALRLHCFSDAERNDAGPDP
jgi:hypothetical protein